MKIICVFLLLATLTYAQKQDVKINPKKPSVYLDFVRMGIGEPLRIGDSRERIWLKLINNTKWSIYIWEFGIRSEKEVGLYHKVVKENEDHSNVELPEGYKPRGARSPYSELKSAKSVMFSVPKNHLDENLMIQIDFLYEWDTGIDSDDIYYSEPRHSIFFSNLDLKKFLTDD